MNECILWNCYGCEQKFVIDHFQRLFLNDAKVDKCLPKIKSLKTKKSRFYSTK